MSHTEFRNSAIAQNNTSVRQHTALIITTVVLLTGLIFAFARAIDMAI